MKLIIINLGFLSCIILAACGTNKKASSVASLDLSDSIVNQQNNQEQRNFIEATKYKALADIPQAINLYNECIRLNPNNDAAYYQLSKIYYENNKYDAALIFIKNAIKLNDENKWYQQHYATVLAANNKYAEAALVYNDLIKKNPAEEEYYFNAANYFLQANKPLEAIDVLNKEESKLGISEELILQKQQIYIRAGKLNEATAELEKLISSKPNEPKYYGMLAEMYEANNQNEKALETYNRMLKVSPDDDRAKIAMANFYFKQKNWNQYYDYTTQIVQSKNVAADTKLSVIAPLLQLAQYDTAKANKASNYVNIIAASQNTNAKVFAVQGDLYMQQNNLNAAEGAYKKALSIKQSDFGVWQQLLIVQSSLNKNDSLLTYSQKAKELFPEQALSYYFNGLAYSKLKKYNEAIQILKKGIPMSGNNDKQKAQFYATLADVYHSNNQHIESDSAFEKCLRLNPDDAYSMNNYAYYLSLRNINLPKAQTLSEGSLLKMPTNASFQDTYGWILYQQKKYQDAKTWIEKAIQNASSANGLLEEHLGDVYYQLGDKDNAVRQWQKAKQIGGTSIDIENKIINKKLSE